MQHIILSGLPGSHVGLIAKRLAFLIGAPFVEAITTGLPDKPPHVYSKEAFFYQQLRLQHALTSAMIVNHHRLTNPIVVQESYFEDVRVENKYYLPLPLRERLIHLENSWYELRKLPYTRVIYDYEVDYLIDESINSFTHIVDAASLAARRELLLKTRRAADYLIVQEEGSVNTLAHNLLDLLHLKVLSPF